MQALLWRDYLCPWCYLGRDRTALMVELGVEVTSLAYELHPEIPREGRPVRPDGRFAAVLERIGAECEVVGLPFRPPSRIANTRRALEVSEVVRTLAPEAFPAVDASFYDAQWVDERDLGDPAVVDALLADAGVDPAPVHAALDAGDGRRAVEASMAEAREHDVTGTPAWWVGDRLLIPGVQDRSTVERWVGRLGARSAAAPEDREGGR
ncbi:MAG TPA: DsbA family protein [Acidimicrobiales bacterium]|nr:DsbA family protein [Acidimicrobiales bacterium]